MKHSFSEWKRSKYIIGSISYLRLACHIASTSLSNSESSDAIWRRRCSVTPSKCAQPLKTLTEGKLPWTGSEMRRANSWTYQSTHQRTTSVSLSKPMATDLSSMSKRWKEISASKISKMKWKWHQTSDMKHLGVTKTRALMRSPTVNFNCLKMRKSCLLWRVKRQQRLEK